MPRIDIVLAQMTLEEKAALCTGASAWTTTPVERLGVPALVMSDGPHGLRKVADADSLANEAIAATCFPPASLTASTWDRELVRSVGEAIAEEASALGVDVVLGPGVNIKRTPLCGRNFEYFSEDPYLAGEMGVAMVQGIQSRGVGASLKHYAVNNQETPRMTVDAVVDERALREIYLAAFEAVVTRAKPWTVMCSYNRINGDYGSEHGHLLRDILKREWGFEGLVVSDWGAVHDRVTSLRAGLDLEMPGPRAQRSRSVVAAVRAGALDERVLDDAARRILGVVMQADSTAPASFDAAAHHALARRVAAAGMVLLRNDGTLPLGDVSRIAVIGRAALHARIQGGGSSHVHPTMVDVPLAEIRRRAGAASVRYAEGYGVDDTLRPDLVAEAAATARDADVALLFVGLPEWKEFEGADREDLDLTAAQLELTAAVTAAQPRTVVVLNNGSAVAMDEWIGGTAAVLEAWMTGQAGAGAIADILFGDVNPSGRLTETFPLRLSDTPAYLSHPGELDEVRYGEGLHVGYRWYDARQMPVLFPFGFGLSYTSFRYGEPRVSSTVVRDVDGVTVEVDVTNTGARAGAEVVQVYVADGGASLRRPVKELKGFVKVHVGPGETATARIALDFRSFAFFHPGHGRWVTESGPVTIHVGASSVDLRGSVQVDLVSTVRLPSGLTRRSTLGDWLADAVGAAILRDDLEQALRGAYRTVGLAGGDLAAHPPTGADLRSMPLSDVLAFAGDALGGDPAEIVEGLLARVREGSLADVG